MTSRKKVTKKAEMGWDGARDLNLTGFFFFSYLSYPPTHFLNIIAEGCFYS